LLGNPEAERVLETFRSRWEGRIKLEVKESEWEGADWIFFCFRKISNGGLM
jgi:hypothetical protein